MELFRCEHLTKKIGDFLLADVDFSLEPGNILGLIGVNGCGKTTLLRSILGSYRLDQAEDRGEFMLGDLHFQKDVKAYREKLAYVLASNPFSEFMHPGELGERYGYYYPGFDQKKYKQKLKEFEISPKKMITELSKGQLLRMQLAFALSYPAKLYVFDEPVGNLDVEFRDAFYDTMRELVAGEESSVILSSHLVTELERVADSVLWLGKAKNAGFERYFGTIDDLKNSYRLVSARDEEGAGIPKKLIRGGRIRENHKEWLIYREDGNFRDVLQDDWSVRFPDLQEIIYFLEKEETQ